MALSAADLAALASLVDEMLDLPAPSRGEWLAALDPEHARLRPVLASLIDDPSSGPIDALLARLPEVAESIAQQAPPDVELAHAGAHVGPYRLLHPLGEGGMGVVWLAVRDDGVLSRSVALKLPHARMPHLQLEQRFARERDILAALEHPHIARLYDAGVTAEGQPYLALECVHGLPINRYCDQQRLGLRARVVLFLQVLAAVQYAHSRLVVHRDVKPSNILVTGAGQAMLLDFGIATLLRDGGDAAATAALTDFDIAALTPDYAAPEQIAGSPVTTATDVYSLGVVFHELLCGQRPYRPARSGRGALEDAILNTEAPRPSEQVDLAAAAARSGELWAIRRQLRGDLDTIAGMTLRKDPGLRYGSALAFEQDLMRWLSGEAVQAHPDSLWYRGRKFVRRHRLPVVALAVAILALAGGLGAALTEARRAREQSVLAITEADKARAVQDFLVGLFDAADPARAQGRAATVTDLMRKAEADLQLRLASQPQVRAAVMGALVEIYNRLEDPEHALGLARARVELLRDQPGTSGLDLGLAAYQYAVALQQRQQCKAALDALATAVPLLSAHLEAHDPREAWLDAQRTQAICLGKLGRDADAVALQRGLIPRLAAHFGADDWEVLFEKSGLVRHLAALGQAQEALALADALAPRLIDPPADKGVEAAVMRMNLGRAMADLGEWVSARALLSGVADRADQLQGATPSAALAQYQLGRVQFALGEYRQAERSFEDARVRLARSLPGDRARQALAAAARVAPLILLQRSGEALAVARDAVALADDDGVALQDRHAIRRRLALALLFNGMAEQAQAELESVQLGEGPSRPGGEGSAVTLHWLAGAQLASGQALAAAGSAILAEKGYRADLPTRAAVVAAASARLTQALTRVAAGQAAQALALSESASQALRDVLPSGHPGLQVAAVVHASALRAAGRSEQGRTLDRSARERLRADFGVVLPASPPLVF